MPGENQKMAIRLPTLTAAATTNRAVYFRNPATGPALRILEVAWMPDTTLALDGSNYATRTLTNETQSVTLATQSTQATADTAGTARLSTVTGAGVRIAPGDVLKLAKTHTGTGGAIGGDLVIHVEEMQ
jgi:hypothetical protein